MNQNNKDFRAHIKNRLGKFFISEDIITKNPLLAQKMLAGCIIVAAGFVPSRACFGYLAYHPDFKKTETDKEEEAPSYTFKVTINDDGEESVEIVLQKRIDASLKRVGRGSGEYQKK